MEYDQAEDDCSRALQLEAPVLNPKTLLRRGTARLGLGKIGAARSDFRQVVSLEPTNRCAPLILTLSLPVNGQWSRSEPPSLYARNHRNEYARHALLQRLLPA